MLSLQRHLGVLPLLHSLSSEESSLDISLGIAQVMANGKGWSPPSSLQVGSLPRFGDLKTPRLAATSNFRLVCSQCGLLLQAHCAQERESDRGNMHGSSLSLLNELP